MQHTLDGIPSKHMTSNVDVTWCYLTFSSFSLLSVAYAHHLNNTHTWAPTFLNQGTASWVAWQNLATPGHSAPEPRRVPGLSVSFDAHAT